MIHICAVAYQLTKDGNLLRGIAVIEEPGLSNILTLLDSEGRPVTASDGGSPDIWDYHLLPACGAVTFWLGKDER